MSRHCQKGLQLAAVCAAGMLATSCACHQLCCASCCIRTPGIYSGLELRLKPGSSAQPVADMDLILNTWIVAMMSCRHADGTLQYIEVKSSAQEQLHIFYITPRELDAAAKFRGQYSIVRVFGCPEAYCRPAVPADCAAALLAGKLPERPLSKKQLANEKQQGRLSARELARQQAAQQQGRMGHTRLLFLRDPVELMRRKLVKLALEV